MPDLDQLRFEVQECSVTLRNEEWGTVITALMMAGGADDLKLDPGCATAVRARVVRQWMEL